MRCRYSFCGSSRATGEERRFFVELYLVNPAVSPNVPVIARRSRVSVAHSPADVQSALTGGYDSRYSGQDVVVRPSYLLVKAGVYGGGGKQMNRFVAPSALVHGKQDASIRAEGFEFTPDAISGEVSVGEQDLRGCPELMCNVGSMGWRLGFDKSSEMGSPASGQHCSWIPLGMAARFAGEVTLDGEEYEVSPESSFGYIDKSWGRSLPNPYFHISSSRLVSVISGKSLGSSSFAVVGELGKDGELSGVLSVDSWRFFLGKGGPFARTEVTHDCVQVPSGGDGEKLHWSLSVVKGGMVIDIDVFCRADEMFVRDYEVPQGRRTALKVLGGGTGTGEVRVYRKRGKNLELLEHAAISGALCEFGRQEAETV